MNPNINSSQRERVNCSFWEALGWTIGYHFAQGLALLCFLLLMVMFAFGGEWPSQEVLINLAIDLELDRSFLLIGVTSLGALFVLLPLIRCRLGRQFRDEIGWRMPTRQETIFAMATIVPIAVLGDVTYDLLFPYFQGAGNQLLFASSIQPDSLQRLHESIGGVPYLILIVAMALGPAVGEELVFRGIIGRGLVARWGFIPGAMVASALFAIAHGSPAHIAATFPVAILLQLLYQQTGTIWIPILVHFGNNLLAVTMVRFQLQPDVTIPTWGVGLFALYLAGIVALLQWHRREMTVRVAA